MASERPGNNAPQTATGTRGRVVVALGTTAALVSTALYFIIPTTTPVVYQAPPRLSGSGDATTTSGEVTRPEDATTTTAWAGGPVPAYVPLPEAVRALYMTQCVVGTPSFRADLVQLIEETELNAVVIDIKDYTGKIAFTTDHPDLAASVSDECGATDMRAFVKTLHEKGIYVIGRITVFQDPYYSLKHPELAVKFADPKGAVWKDHKGLSFIDVGAKPYWDYIVTLSREAHKLGFDELNYDYIRYPSDGPMKNIHFDWAGDDKPKQVALEEFFAYLSKEMRSTEGLPPGVRPPVISADLFGMTTTNYDDLNIGQVLERTMPYFDFIAPMVYPSHYPSGFNGWNNPNTVPYDLIHFVLEAAVKRAVADRTTIEHFGGEPIMETIVVPPTGSSTATTTKEVFSGYYTKEVYDPDIIRPWIQDFDYGGNYDVAEVKAQIQAAYDVGLDSWMLWAPSNRYTRGALKDAPGASTETPLQAL